MNQPYLDVGLGSCLQGDFIKSIAMVYLHVFHRQGFCHCPVDIRVSVREGVSECEPG